VKQLAQCYSLSPAPSTSALYTLSLHDALPIWLPGLIRILITCVANCNGWVWVMTGSGKSPPANRIITVGNNGCLYSCSKKVWFRSEEHTSELQSREKLVCRLLLEKKKKIKNLG